MEKPQKLTVLAVQWSPDDAALLRSCFTVAGALEIVAGQVERGEASLFRVLVDSGEVIGAFVLRADGDEGVIVAANGPVEIMRELLPHMEGRFSGCKAVRVHTARPAMVKIMRAAGYLPQEFVMRRNLNG